MTWTIVNRIDQGYRICKNNNSADAIADIDEWQTLEETLHNARLISATPELLEACKRSLPWLSKALAEDINKDCAMPNDLNQTIALIKFALSKVKGNEV
jgi:hypothetical protein